MGGQDGIRGYVYQGIVAIIKALGEASINPYLDGPSLSGEKEEMLTAIKQYIEYETINGTNNNLIIKCEIASLRPEEAVMLGKYLVFQDVVEGTVISYSIMSQESSERIEGKLFLGLDN